MADENLERWRRILRRFLGNASTKNYKKIIVDLILVSSGLKPSLLFDYACMELQKAREMLDELEADGLLRGRLDVICLGQDIFIADLNILVRCLKETLTNQSFYLVDVSGSLPEPSVVASKTHSHVTGQFAQVLNFLEGRLCDRNAMNGRGYMVNAIVQDDWNLTSLYGFLLSYPVIYWFAPSTCSSADFNCLAFNPLAVHTVKLKVQRSWETLCSPAGWPWLAKEGFWLDHTAFSFSVPVALEKDCRNFIDKWRTSLLKTAESLGIKRDLVDIGSEVVVLSQVAL